MTEISNQNGRSMVEMLGVLAIIGVLSVAGIKGYTVAMNRHKANELINEANKRATMLAAQIMAGRNGADLSIDEFTNNNTGYGTFSLGADAYPDGSETFKLTLSGVPADVCVQMKSYLGDESIMAIEGDCGTTEAPADHLTVRFNKELTKGVSNSSSGGQTTESCNVANCATCEVGNSTKCAVCNSNFHIVGGVCIDNNESGCICDHCTSCMYIPPDIYLVEACEAGYLGTNDACYACPTNSWTRGDAEHSVDEDQPISNGHDGTCYCDQNNLNIGGECKIPCPGGVGQCSDCASIPPYTNYYWDGNKCVQCLNDTHCVEQGFLTCNSEGTCD